MRQTLIAASFNARKRFGAGAEAAGNLCIRVRRRYQEGIPVSARQDAPAAVFKSSRREILVSMLLAPL